MASGMVPIDLIRDQETTSDEVMVYLAVSVLGGSKLSVSEIANLARLNYRDAQMALFSLLERGLIEVTGGFIRLGPLGGAGS